MKLYEFDDDNIITAVAPFDSSEWYLSVAPLLHEHLIMNYGDRDTFTNSRIRSVCRQYRAGHATKEQVKNTILQEMQKAVRMLLISKDRSYTMMYRAYMEEFDPLWNVDGTEVLEYTRTNTGTQTNVIDQDDKNTGTQTNAAGTTNTATSSATTYDSATWKDTAKDVSANSGQDTRTDNLKYERDQTDTRTDNLTEHYKEEKKRGGNIGLTKSTELLTDSWNTFDVLNFLEKVSHDIANVITLTTYEEEYECIW